MLPSRLLAQGCAALVLVAGAAAAAAQGVALEVLAAAEPVTHCLTRSIDKPAYPPQADEAGAVVRASLTFTAPDAAPEVEITYDEGKPAFVAEVRRFVAGYRLPCLPAGQQAKARQEFQFVFRKPVISGAVHDPEPVIPETCRAAVRDWRTPSPRQTEGELGFVLMRFVFKSASEPPQVEVLDNSGSARLARAITSVAQDFRMPCASPEKPIAGVQLYMFAIEKPEIRATTPTLTLRQLLAIVRPEDRTGVRFDFRTMNCPFALQVTPYMPHASNTVREMSEPSADRLEFIAWLRRVRFDLPRGGIATLNIQPPKVEVPCAVLDLT